MSELRVVATGLCFPEGPVAMRDGSVVLTEIERQTISRVLPDGTVQVIAHTGGGPNGLAVGPDGAFYVCNNGGFAWRLEDNLFRPAMVSSDYVSGSIQRVDPRTGAVSVLYDRCGANKLNGPNDIVFDAQWRLLFHRSRQDPRARPRQRGDLLRAGGRLEDRRGRLSRRDAERHRPVAGRHGALCRRDRAGAALGVRHHRAGRGEEAGLAVAAWRAAGHRPSRLPAVRQPGGGGFRQHLRRDADHRLHQRDRPGRAAGAAGRRCPIR